MRKFKVSCISYVLLIGIILLGVISDVKAEAITSAKTEVYLTFDDGPSEYTDKLLDTLYKYDMKATFFMLKDEMLKYPQVVNRIIKEGHSIGVHGVTHEKCDFYRNESSPLEEMNEANRALWEISGYSTKFIRTPYGTVPYLSKEQEAQLTKEGYIIWDWNIDSRDWSYRNPSKTFYHVTQDIKSSNNSTKVILLHDIKLVNETMELLAKWMDDNGYTSKAISMETCPVRLINYRKK